MSSDQARFYGAGTVSRTSGACRRQAASPRATVCVCWALVGWKDFNRAVQFAVHIDIKGILPCWRAGIDVLNSLGVPHRRAGRALKLLVLRLSHRMVGADVHLDGGSVDVVAIHVKAAGITHRDVDWEGRVRFYTSGKSHFLDIETKLPLTGYISFAGFNHFTLTGTQGQQSNHTCDQQV